LPVEWLGRKGFKDSEAELAAAVQLNRASNRLEEQHCGSAIPLVKGHSQKVPEWHLDTPLREVGRDGKIPQLAAKSSSTDK
jgi:hypothetical protein